MRLLENEVEPEIRTLVIRRRPDMASVTLMSPLPDSLFVAEEAPVKGLAFSWVPNAEAVAYHLALSRSPDMRNPAITAVSKQPWIILSGTDAEPIADTGIWYWTLTWTDDEGNESPRSEQRVLRGMEGLAGLRLSFPPQDYTIADSLAGNTRFAWKSDMPASTVFEVSEDQTFSTIEREQICDGGTVLGGQLRTGTWYWRVSARNVDGTILFVTPPRRFRVIGPLPQPVSRNPVDGSRIYLRMEDGYTFSWDGVAGADFYRFGLYRKSATGEVLSYSAELERTSIELPLGVSPAGEYRVELQGFGRDKELSTRLIGYLGSTGFSLQRISHLTLSAPADGAFINGLPARRQGVTLSWQTADRPDSCRLLLSQDPGLRTILRRYEGAF